MKIYLIRHAKTKDSANGIHQSDGTPIITEGVDFSIYKDLKPEKVYSSPQTRAIQTAERLFGEYEVLDYTFEYKRPTSFVGKSKQLSHDLWNKEQIHLRTDPDWKFEDAESFNEIKERAEKFLNFLKTLEYESVAVIGHGIFFRYVMGVRALGEHFTPNVVFDLLSYINWSNLEIKEIEL